MFKNYLENTLVKESENEPKNQTLYAILNYSKSLKIDKVKGEKIVIHLN